MDDLGNGCTTHHEACACREAAHRAEVERLRQEVVGLRRQVTGQAANNHKRNVELDALHYVWCDGGCEAGVHRYEHRGPLTDEMVEAAIRNTNRLIRWSRNARFHELPMEVRINYLSRQPEIDAARRERDALRSDLDTARLELAAERAVSASLREQLASLSEKVAGQSATADTVGDYPMGPGWGVLRSGAGEDE